MEVVDQEARKTACQRGRQQRQRRFAPHTGCHREENHHRKRHAGRQTVDAIGEIDRVHAADNDEHRKNQIDNPVDLEADVPEWNVKIAGQISVPAQQRQIRARSRQLQSKLLDGGQTEVALIFDLHKIIEKADDAENQRERQHIKVREISRQHAPPAAGNRAQRRRGDEDESSHCGCPRLRVVPAGTDFADRLPGFERAQHGDE